jgi:hypothetical protein
VLIGARGLRFSLRAMVSALRALRQYNASDSKVAQDALRDFVAARGIGKDAQLDGDAKQIDRVSVHNGSLGAIKASAVSGVPSS